MALLRYRNCHSVRFALVLGMMLGAALLTIFTLFIWSLSPLHGVMVPRVMSSFLVLQDMSGSPLGQLNRGGGRGERCVCRQESGSGLESKDDGAMDGLGSSSFQDTTQTSSLHYLDVVSTPARIQQHLFAGAEQQAVQSTGRGDALKEVKDGVFKQQLSSVDVTPGRVGFGDDRGRSVFQSIRSGKRMGETLVMAVIIGGTQLEWAKSVYATWGRDASHLVFYMEGQSNISIQEARRLGLQVVKLNTSTNMHTRLALLQHLSEHYEKSHQWFVVVTEDTYVHMDQLEAVLGRLSPEEPLLLGLPPHCQVRGQRRNGSSMVLNQALLSLLTHQLHLCLNENMDVADSHGSAEIEACVGEHLNIVCSIPSSMQAYFVEAEEGLTSISTRLLQSQNKLFSFLLTYSPLRQTEDMYILHYHYKKTQLMGAVEKTKHFLQEIKQVCSSLGPSFLSAKDCISNLLREAGQSHNQSSSKCSPNGVIVTMPQPFHPMSIYDLPWQYFDSKTIYHDQSTLPNIILKSKRYVEEELQQASIQALQKISIGLRKGLKLKRLVNGWVRHNPTMGNEYIFDYLFTDGRNKISKRASLVRPLAKNYISLKDKFVHSVTVNIVIPISVVNQKLTKFMTMYENLVLISRRNVNLVLSVYGQEDVIKVETLLAQYHVKYKFANVTMVEGKGEFSRSKAVHLGLSQLLPNDLVFICDVDMVISPSFLDRCRNNAVQSSRVYFPDVFKNYNTDFVYWNWSKSNHSRISRSTGYWDFYGFGMLCIYKSDYDSVGGMDTNITGWGGEDVTFFHKVLKKRLQVMRAPDVGLTHQWHPKHCAKTLSAEQYEQCQASMNEDLADKRELARFVYGQLIPPKTTTAEARPTKSTASSAISIISRAIGRL